MTDGDGAAAAAAAPEPSDYDPVLVCLPRWAWPKVLRAVRRHHRELDRRLGKQDRSRDAYALAALVDAEAQIEAALGHEPTTTPCPPVGDGVG